MLLLPLGELHPGPGEWELEEVADERNTGRAWRHTAKPLRPLEERASDPDEDCAGGNDEDEVGNAKGDFEESFARVAR